MSGTCGDCDCASKDQCVKKGSSYGIVIVEEKSFIDTAVVEAPAAVHNGKCKCGDSCACVNCTCGQ